MALTQGDHILLRLKGGDKGAGDVWRHCIVIGDAVGVYHKVLTPARMIRDQDFSSKEIKAILPFDGKTAPAKLPRKSVFLDVDSPQGAFSDLEIQSAIGQARKLTKAPPVASTRLVISAAPRPRAGSPVRGAIRDVASPKRAPGRAGSVSGSPGSAKASPRVRIRTKQRVEGDNLDGELADDETEPRPAGRTANLAEGEGWYVASGHEAAVAGSPVQLAGTKHALLGNKILFDKSGVECVAIWSKPESLEKDLRCFQVSTSGRPADSFDGLANIFR